VSVDPFKLARIESFQPKLKGESDFRAKRLSITISLFVVLMEINNIDNSEREEKEGCNDQTAHQLSCWCYWNSKKHYSKNETVEETEGQYHVFKSKLNDDNFLNRLYHCISKIDKNTITGATGMKYKTMHNEVHI
jgi:hypothetical protein